MSTISNTSDFYYIYYRFVYYSFILIQCANELICRVFATIPNASFVEVRPQFSKTELHHSAKQFPILRFCFPNFSGYFRFKSFLVCDALLTKEEVFIEARTPFSDNIW